MRPETKTQTHIIGINNALTYEERNNNTSNNGQWMYQMRNPDVRYPSRSQGISECLTDNGSEHSADLELNNVPRNRIKMSECPNTATKHGIDKVIDRDVFTELNNVDAGADADAIEIIITRDRTSTDIHIDVVRETSLSNLDFSHTEVLASTFDERVQSKYPAIFDSRPRAYSRQTDLEMPQEQTDSQFKSYDKKCIHSFERESFIARTSPGGGDFKGTPSTKCLRQENQKDFNNDSSHSDSHKHVHFADTTMEQPHAQRSRKRNTHDHGFGGSGHAKQATVYLSRSDVDSRLEPGRRCTNESTHRKHDAQRKHGTPIGRAHVAYHHTKTAVVSVSDIFLSTSSENASDHTGKGDDLKVKEDPSKMRYQETKAEARGHSWRYGTRDERGYEHRRHYQSESKIKRQCKDETIERKPTIDASSRLNKIKSDTEKNNPSSKQQHVSKTHNVDQALMDINNANVLNRIPGIIVLKRTPVKVFSDNRSSMDHQDTHAKMLDGKNDNVRKTKVKRKKLSKQKLAQPKSEMEIFQRQIEMGLLRSMISKYKTDSLREMVLKDRIYEGTFSVKYKASLQNEQVVVSIYTGQDVSDISVLDMAQVRHSYFINGVRDCICGPGSSLWLLYRHYPLGDLQKLLDRDVNRHVIGETHAQFVTASILIGIEYLHRHDIVHGNIKPSKILISKEGFPVLTGFLKLEEDPDQERRDVYTLAYAAPERFRGDRGPPVDVFSVGCLAYQVVTGSTPFDGGTCEDTKANILTHNYQPLYEPELFSYAGEEFIHSCLRTNAAGRFRLEVNRSSLSNVEWFSSIDLKALKKQMVKSPILDLVQLMDNHARLSCEEKLVEYNWGRVMDVTCPDTPSLEG